MNRTPRRLFAVVGIGVMLALAVPLSSASSTEDDPQILRVGVPNDLTTANPLSLRSGSDWNVATIQYDMMLQFGNDDLSPQPGLAKECVPNGDLTEWTCTFQEGVLWSDGEPFTARDVAFTYELVINQEISTYAQYFTEGTTFETPDDTTLVWKSKMPTSQPETPPWIYILPEHVWSEYADLDKADLRAVENVPSVTTGPFTLTEVDRGQNWTLTKNPNYWGDEPNYDEIRFQLFTNQDAMAQALMNGDIDVATNVESALLPSLESDPNITVQRNVSDWWLNLAFNFGGQGEDSDPLSALQDKTVRTAIAMAIDKQGIVDKAYDGAATPGTSLIRQVPEQWHYDVPEDEQIPYDPDAANTLLDEAGYLRGDDDVRVDPATGDRLVIRMPISQETAGALPAGQLLVGYLDQIGIEVEIFPVNEGKMYSYWNAGDWDAYIWYWTGEPDPNYQLTTLMSNQCGELSDGCWANADYDALVEQQETIIDPEERQAVVQEALALSYAEVPSIALAYPNNIEAYRNDQVTNFTPVPGDNGYLIPNYNNVGMVTVEPASESSSSAAGASTGMPAWGWAALIGGVGVATFVFFRRRGRVDEEEG
ncbi:MAG: ABC transporter substrate-binding protein [Actinomycetia bacterium]|nr:ABC transporter substrate-binding protein [Actinomycetes bacterium]